MLNPQITTLLWYRRFITRMTCILCPNMSWQQTKSIEIHQKFILSSEFITIKRFICSINCTDVGVKCYPCGRPRWRGADDLRSDAIIIMGCNLSWSSQQSIQSRGQIIWTIAVSPGPLVQMIFCNTYDSHGLGCDTFVYSKNTDVRILRVI